MWSSAQSPAAASSAARWRSARVPQSWATGASEGHHRPRRGHLALPVRGDRAQTDGTVHVPDGYSWKTLVRWGDPLFSDAPAFDPPRRASRPKAPTACSARTPTAWSCSTSTAARSSSSTANTPITTPTCRTATDPGRAGRGGHSGVAPTTCCACRTSRACRYGDREGSDGWAVVVDSPFNRRITHLTPMTLDGPAAGHDLMKTEADPDGHHSRSGRFNNCGAGRTPWGTYLTCEENFNGYFGATGELPTDDDRRRRLQALRHQRAELRLQLPRLRPPVRRLDRTRTSRTAPATSSRSTRPTRHRPRSSAPRSAASSTRTRPSTLAADDRVVVYMGDDERGEFMYKWCRARHLLPGGDTSTLLTDGQLYVAKFDDDMTGEWVALTPETTGMDAAMIAIFTRTAASAVGATTMDRPEWIAVNPTAVGGLLLPHQQLAPRRPARTARCHQRRRRPDVGERAQPARGQRVRPDRALAPARRRPRRRHVRRGTST